LTVTFRKELDSKNSESVMTIDLRWL